MPINEGAGSGKGCQALADFLRHLARAGSTGEFQPQASLSGRIAPADLDQQLSQALGSKSLKILGVQSLLGSHVVS
jgi:hypothetical protein